MAPRLDMPSNLYIILSYLENKVLLQVVVWLILLVMRSRIGLVAQLFKEAGKAIGAMPLLLFQPIWVSIPLII